MLPEHAFCPRWLSPEVAEQASNSLHRDISKWLDDYESKPTSRTSIQDVFEIVDRYLSEPASIRCRLHWRVLRVRHPKRVFITKDIDIPCTIVDTMLLRWHAAMSEGECPYELSAGRDEVIACLFFLIGDTVDVPNVEEKLKEAAITIRSLRNLDKLNLKKAAVAVGKLADMLTMPMHQPTTSKSEEKQTMQQFVYIGENSRNADGGIVIANQPKHYSLTMMPFAFAMLYVLNGKRARRHSWPTDTWVHRIDPFHNPQFEVREKPGMEGTLYSAVYMKGPNNELYPWVPSQLDMFADDWTLFIEDMQGYVPHEVYVCTIENSEGINIYVPDYRIAVKADRPEGLQKAVTSAILTFINSLKLEMRTPKSRTALSIEGINTVLHDTQLSCGYWETVLVDVDYIRRETIHLKPANG